MLSQLVQNLFALKTEFGENRGVNRYRVYAGLVNGCRVFQSSLRHLYLSRAFRRVQGRDRLQNMGHLWHPNVH